MAFINLVDRLHRDIGAALREDAFLELFQTVAEDSIRRETVVAEQLHRRGIEATALSVVKAPAGFPGQYQVDWQPKAGGEVQHQWFFPPED